MATWELGADVSTWQGNINFAKMKQAGVKWVCIRATVGDYITDSKLTRNVPAALDAGFDEVLVYHVVAPNEKGTGRSISAAAQINYFLNHINRWLDQVNTVLDCEVRWRNTPANTFTCVKKCVNLLTQANEPPEIYTNLWWNEYIGPKETFGCKLWVANHNVNKPTLPAAWKEWKRWQFSADGNGRGAEFGCESNSVDLNWRIPLATPPPPAYTLEQKVQILWDLHKNDLP